MMLEEPHIELKALEAITAPTLVLAGDHDLIRDEHTVDIYHHIPNSQLAIFPNATHMVPFDDPALFNADRRAVLPHPVREDGPDRRHDEVIRETAGTVWRGRDRRMALNPYQRFRAIAAFIFSRTCRRTRRAPAGPAARAGCRAPSESCRGPPPRPVDPARPAARESRQSTGA